LKIQTIVSENVGFANEADREYHERKAEQFNIKPRTHMAFTPYETQLFVNHYLGTAAVLESDHQEINAGSAEWSEGAKAHAKQECEAFLEKAAVPLNEALNVEGYVLEQAATDFFLSRNGHGAGFFDRGLGRSGEILQELSKAFGASDTYTENGVMDFERPMTAVERKAKM
jgi:hypothetical protein